MFSLQVQFIFSLLILTQVSCRLSTDHENRHNWYEKNRLKVKCLQRDDPTGRNAVKLCWFWEGTKSWFRRTSISWFPERTKTWNLTELTAHCNNYYVCMENTKCYKDYVLYETLDRCSHDAFNVGPMSFCNQKLKEIKKSSPEKLSNCTMEYLEEKPPKRWTCESVKRLGDCLYPEVEKYCDSKLLPIFKDHQESRLYYLGCDGRLKFKDFEEPTNSTIPKL
ncbi:hypothetical protein CAEBREN_09767 [Caenorhabditis brenneri]|uniref:T20D4.11-like domain-containing protein n=1 Tax=Caenorhabditis brenneri TaxID=135651 RepID=G0NEY6_CAEBE|nr:hypothetical protein CAEBREN_09767 [Caenorhabditis brenneri]